VVRGSVGSHDRRNRHIQSDHLHFADLMASSPIAHIDCLSELAENGHSGGFSVPQPAPAVHHRLQVLLVRLELLESQAQMPSPYSLPRAIGWLVDRANHALAAVLSPRGISVVVILAAAFGLELLGYLRRGLLARWGKAAP
jgi:hypothetical protein